MRIMRFIIVTTTLSFLQQRSFSSASILPLQASSASSQSLFHGAQCHQPGSGGMKLEAVMETLQRQQAARLALEEKTEEDLRSTMESQMHQQAEAILHCQAAVRGGVTAGVTNSDPAVSPWHLEIQRDHEDGDSSRPDGEHMERAEEEDDMDDHEILNKRVKGEDDFGLTHYQHRQSSLGEPCVPPQTAKMLLMAGVPPAFALSRRSASPSAHHPPQHHEWTYEEQFKQVRQRRPLSHLRSATLRFPHVSGSFKVICGPINANWKRFLSILSFFSPSKTTFRPLDISSFLKEQQQQ